jgi:predicted alpha/beta-hydrolase family hydrolase
MVGTAERIQARGFDVVTFDFPYTEEGKKLPDKNDVLEQCFSAVFAAVKEKTKGPIFAGGKSMGGRISSQVTAKKAIDPAGLVLLGYPLHPPAKPEQRRDAHLPDIRVPMLFVQGTRDVFGTADDMGKLVPNLAKGSRVYAVENGDHSHAVPKRSGGSPDAVYDAIADAIVAFMTKVAKSGRPVRR